MKTEPTPKDPPSISCANNFSSDINEQWKDSSVNEHPMESSSEHGDHCRFSLLPAHIINSENKKRQRKIYKRILQKAGMSSNGASLSCIEIESDEDSDDPGNSDRMQYQYVHRHNPHQAHYPRQSIHNHQRMNPYGSQGREPPSSPKTSRPWLGAASQKLYDMIESSRAHDITGRPFKVDPMRKLKNGPMLEEAKVYNEFDGIERRSKYAVEENSKWERKKLQKDEIYECSDGSLPNVLFKTNVEENFGKLIFTNGTVYIGNVSCA